MLLATVHSYAAFFDRLTWAVISLSFSAGFMHSPMVLANSWFQFRRRAMAMTLISSAIGIGGTLITPYPRLPPCRNGVGATGAFIAGLGLIAPRRSGGALCEAFAGKYGPGADGVTANI